MFIKTILLEGYSNVFFITNAAIHLHHIQHRQHIRTSPCQTTSKLEHSAIRIILVSDLEPTMLHKFRICQSQNWIKYRIKLLVLFTQRELLWPLPWRRLPDCRCRAGRAWRRRGRSTWGRGASDSMPSGTRRTQARDLATTSTFWRQWPVQTTRSDSHTVEQRSV